MEPNYAGRFAASTGHGIRVAATVESLHVGCYPQHVYIVSTGTEPVLPKIAADKTWGVLESAIEEIHNQNASGLSFEELYR